MKIPLLKPKIKRKALMVDNGTLLIIKTLARKRNLNVQDMTHTLLIYGLAKSLGVRREPLPGEKAILKVLKSMPEADVKLKNKMTVRLLLPKDQEKHLIVNPELHLAVSQYARFKGLTVHEATYFLMQHSILHTEGLDNNDVELQDPIGNIYKKVNGIQI
jgi:hypothetical protein